jgi:proteasome lid subunit RPN8/RPN11
MPKVPVAYENPRHALYFRAVARVVRAMSGKSEEEAERVVELDRSYVDSAMRGAVGADVAAAVIFHKHFGEKVVAADRGASPLGASCPPPTAREGVSCPPPEEKAPGGSGETLTPCGPFARMVVDEQKLETCRASAVALGSLTKPENVYALLRPYMERETVEIFVVLGFDVNMVVNCYAEVARGQVDHVAVAPQDIMALVMTSKAFLVAHSHPSGDATPSRDDKILTEKVAAAAAVFPGLVFLDHLVIGHGEFYSFTEKKKRKAKAG